MQTANALKSIHPQLHTFFMPQIEQMHMSLHEHAGGVLGKDDNHFGCGHFFAMQLGDTCLITSHCLQAKTDFHMEEEPTRSLCIASLTDVGVSFCPVDEIEGTNALQPHEAQISDGNGTPTLRPSENITVFNQIDQRYSMQLHTGEAFNSVSVCLLPGYFQNLEAHFGTQLARQAEELMDCRGFILDDESAPYLRAALRAAGDPNTSFAQQAQNNKHIQNCVALLTVREMERQRANAHRGALSHRQMAQRVCAIIQADPAHAPGVNDLASMFHISRSRLCAIFKAETGISIGTFIANARVALACNLLDGSRLSVADIANATGYRHQSSFAEAFRRSTGKTPLQWRHEHK